MARRLLLERHPNYVVTLEVVGRTSGKTTSLPMVVTVVGEKRYVVSLLGENVNWVHNAKRRPPSRRSPRRSTLEHWRFPMLYLWQLRYFGTDRATIGTNALARSEQLLRPFGCTLQFSLF